jgi:DNA ligase (NAD+)
MRTVRHAAPMLSLDNAYDEDDARAFDERLRRALEAGDEQLPYVAELKIDGLSIALTFDRGVLVRGVTRGDGVQGEDVTANVRTIKSVPRKLQGGPAHAVEVRGEVFLPRASFERINKEREEQGEPLFANARNAAAGTIRTLDPDLVKKRALGAFTYQLVDSRSGHEEAAADRGPASRSHAATLERMKAWASTRCSSSAASGPRSATISSSRPTASSSSSTISNGAIGRGRHRSSRAGRSPTSFPPSRRRRCCGRFVSKSGAQGL